MKSSVTNIYDLLIGLEEKEMDQEVLHVMKELPLDVLQTICDIHRETYYPGSKKYLVECIIRLDMTVNWQGCSAWHNDDPGEDEMYGTIFPIVQVIYDGKDTTWHQPGVLVQAPLPVEENNTEGSYTKKEVGFNLLKEKVVDKWMTSALMKRNTQQTLQYLEKHQQEGSYRTYRKYVAHDYVVTWESYYSTSIRIREIVDDDDCTIKKSDDWSYPTPGYHYDMFQKYNPYPFKTKHTYVYDVDATNIVETWEEVKEHVRKGSFPH